MELENFYYKQNDNQRECLLILRQLIKELDPHIVETLKYGLPCFVYTKKPLFYLSVDKKSSRPYILFVHCQSLEHKNLDQKDRKKMKSYEINHEADIPLEEIQSLLMASIAELKNKYPKI